MRKKWIAIVAILVVLGGGGYYWQTTRTKAAAAQKAPSYVFATVKKGEIRNTISGTGPVASVNGVQVKSNQVGTVTKLLAQDGDSVKAGQVIVELENDTLQAQVRQAEIDLESARANLDNLLNPQATAVRAQMLKVESSKLTLKQRQEDQANLQVKATKSGVVTAVKTTEGSDVAANALLATIYDDSTPTFTVQVPQQAASAIKDWQLVDVTLPGFGTVQGHVKQSAGAATPGSGNRDATVPVVVEMPNMPGVRPGMVGQARIVAEGLDFVVQASGAIDNDAVEVRAKVAATVGTLNVAEGARVTEGDVLLSLTSESVSLAVQQAENDVKTQEQNLDNLLTPANDPTGQLRSLRAKLDGAQVSLASKQADMEDLQVKAPVSGQISSLTLKVGDRVTANANLFRVADYNQMQITIAVDELDVAKTKVGQKAEITLDALPGKTYAGTVTKINPEGVVKNDIATFEVTVTVDKPAGLMAGMNASVNVVVEQKSDVLWLPAAAVQVRGGKAFVQVLENNQVVQKEVQVGSRTSQQAEIVSGLSVGDQVIQTIIRTQTTSGFGIFGGGNRAGTGGAPAGGAPGATTPQQGNQNRQNFQRQGTGGTGNGGGGTTGGTGR